MTIDGDGTNGVGGVSPSMGQSSPRGPLPASAPYLVGFFATTYGQDGENLGSDCSDIILLCWVVVSVHEEKVVTVQRTPVQLPDLSKASQEVLSERGITEDLHTCPTLQDALQQFENYVCSNSLQGSYAFVTDGPLPLRQCLLPDAARRGISLPDAYYCYCDIRKEFRRLLPANSAAINSVADIIRALDQEPNTSDAYGLRQCSDLANCILYLVKERKEKGVQCFADPEIIKSSLEYGTCAKSDVVDSNTVVRARGLPWQSSDHDVARFFAGLNITKGGVALCLSQQGRRNGEALVRLETVEHRDLALKRHRHFMGNRYIEVYKANGEDFINVAAGSNDAVQQFLAKGADAIIRMRGLPYNSTPQDIIEFFKRGEHGCDVMDGDEGILFINKPNGDATGDAYVLIKNEEEAKRAVQAKHKDTIGTRYIELFHTTVSEVHQVVNQTSQPAQSKQQNGAGAGCLIEHAGLTTTPVPGLGFLGVPHQASLPATALTTGTLPNFLSTQPMAITGAMKSCIRLRGLPYEAEVEDVLGFLGDFSKHILTQGVHMVYNAAGGKTGEAFIQMDGERTAAACAIDRHNKYMQHGKKQRYIEVFQCSVDDMNLILRGHSPTDAILTATLLTSPTRLPMQQNIPQAALFQSPTPFMAGGALSPFGGQPTNAAVLQQQLLQMQAFQQALQMQAMAQAGAARMHSPGGATFFPGLVQGQPGGTYYYWPIPSPPMSPNSGYMNLTAAAIAQAQQAQQLQHVVHPQPGQQLLGPGYILMRGVPPNASYADVLTFFQGFPEITPDCIQFQRTPEGHLSGDVLVQFPSRIEAERAVMEKNRRIFGSRPIDLFVVAI